MVLATIRQHPGLTAAEIAAKTGLSGAQARREVTGLRTRAWIQSDTAPGDTGRYPRIQT